MKIEQIYTGCLAEAAYYIESKGEAVIIDPLRETQPYIDKAIANGAKIKYVLETHFHADFVSGHIDLAKKTGATIVFGPNANPSYDVHIAEDEEELTVGELTIKVLHTPGHTMESTTYLLIDENGLEHAIFTGDTLFIGDVGRPDLAAKSELTVDDLAGHLFDSLRNKIMTLPDDVIVYPAHGAGSACGKNMSSKTFDLLGNQKQSNYALVEDMSKQEFVNAITDGLEAPPQYFPKNVALNKYGYMQLDTVLEKGSVALNAKELERIVNDNNALILDTRYQDIFAKGFIPGSIFIGLDGDFAPWVGSLISDIEQPIVFISEPGREEEVVIRLARVGYDNTLGYLEGGVQSWMKYGGEIVTLDEIDPPAFAERFGKENLALLDVRRVTEYQAEHIENSINFPLGSINENMADLNPIESYYLHCTSGYRSVIATSILKARGWTDVVNIKEGYKGLVRTRLLKTTFVEQCNS